MYGFNIPLRARGRQLYWSARSHLLRTPSRNLPDTEIQRPDHFHAALLDRTTASFTVGTHYMVLYIPLRYLYRPKTIKTDPLWTRGLVKFSSVYVIPRQ